MRIEKIICDRCGKEISPLMNKPSITLHRNNRELDLCGMCITRFYKWFNEKDEREVLHE